MHEQIELLNSARYKLNSYIAKNDLEDNAELKVIMAQLNQLKELIELDKQK